MGRRRRRRRRNRRKLWKEGLAKWGQDGERIKRLRDAADFRIYTPGSNAGLPVSILKSFAAPPETIRQDNESLAERINTTVTSLLALDRHRRRSDSQPRTHSAFKHSQPGVVQRKRSRHRGSDSKGSIAADHEDRRDGSRFVLPRERSFRTRDGAESTCSRRRVLRAGWKAKPLDIPKFLHTEAGKPRLSIFSIAHLGDAERMFFVSLLLNQVLGWMRTQSGTTSLRAILYMDEIFGYFPPVANPPSKLPLLTLLKQGRAFGLGVVLATQNPVDLDYKGLANTGTWFIGRLQTERDKARVLEGLEGIAAGTGQKFDKQEMEQLLAGLDKRIFLLNNVHDDAPEVFETRWAMSYLRGPLTRTQIKTVDGSFESRTAAAGKLPQQCLLLLLHRVASAPPNASEPVLPPEITQYYIPVRSSGDANASLTYHPMLLGAAEVRYSNSKTVDMTQQLTLLAAIRGWTS